MRIAYVTQAPLPSREANSVQVMKMCASLADLGHCVILMAPLSGRHGSDAGTFAYYGVRSSFEVARIRRKDGRGSAYDFALRAAMRARIEHVDLVYGRCLHTCFLTAISGLRTVLELHGTLPNAGVRTLLQLRLMAKLPNVRLVVISAALRRHFVSQGFREDRIVVAHDAADLPARPAHPISFSGPPDYHVGYVGSLYEGRGVELIVELSRRCPWASFHVVGGKDDDVAKWRLRTQSIANVCFHGFVSPGETLAYRDACSVLVAPYQEDLRISDGKTNTVSYMSPLKVFEYMASGKPIVASDLPVLREVLTPEQNALLCPPDDLDCWTQALLRLYGNPEFASSLAKRAQQDMRLRHTWRARAQKVLAPSASFQ